MKDSARYLRLVYWSDEDACYVGKAPRLVYGGCHGDDKKAVYAELCDIVDEVIESYKHSGELLPPPTASSGLLERMLET